MFQFLEQTVLPDSKLINVASDDAMLLGVLGSRIHGMWTLAVGSRLGVGNDPTYVKSASFDKFPFPVCGEAEKARVRELAEALDAHRKRVQAAHAGLTLTGMYNVLEKLRAEEPLTAKEKVIHEQGLVSILRQLHDDLDAAVFDAYGWGHLWQARQEAHQGSIYDFKTGVVRDLEIGPEGLAVAVADFERELDAEILRRLVALNAQRAEEEARGIIHWLRPDYQKRGAAQQTELGLKPGSRKPETRGKPKGKAGAGRAKAAWPKALAERIKAAETALHALPPGGAVTAAALAGQFARASAADLQEILETLVALGRARVVGEGFGV